MENNTRQLFDQYIARQAQLNGVSPPPLLRNLRLIPPVSSAWSRHGERFFPEQN
jgi:hypothetical protein